MSSLLREPLLGGSAEGQRALRERPSGGPPGTPASLPSSCCFLSSILFPRSSWVSCHVVLSTDVTSSGRSSLDHRFKVPCFPASHLTLLFLCLYCCLNCLICWPPPPRQNVGSVTAATCLCADGSDPWWEQGPRVGTGPHGHGRSLGRCLWREGEACCRDRP